MNINNVEINIVILFMIISVGFACRQTGGDIQEHQHYGWCEEIEKEEGRSIS